MVWKESLVYVDVDETCEVFREYEARATLSVRKP
jgi:hypothetical protein